MDSLLSVSRRNLMRLGIGAAAVPPLSQLLTSSALAQDAGPDSGKLGAIGGRSETELFPGEHLQGGGQLEIRLTVSTYSSDPDQVEVAQRMKPYNLDSWLTEWTRVAERAEEEGDALAKQGLKVSANEAYLKASQHYREACWPAPVTEPRMMATYKKMRDCFDKAWKQTRAPFEKVQVSIDGKMLDGYFRKPGGPAGKKFPVVIAFQGADTMAEATIMNAGSYIARGMAYFAMDFPGQGGALRLHDLHLPPDTERIAKAIIDYLETRPDVDAKNIGMQGISMGGFGSPRAASGESRIKAVLVSSGSYHLGQDLFDYYPPIQERVRWIIGAKDLADAKKKLNDYTLEGRANKIEAALLVGYSKDDRIMDPAGALRLYKAATNAKRDMMEGTGHVQAFNAGGPRNRRGPVMQDWAMRHLVVEA
jgi:dienelactone hydrolase